MLVGETRTFRAVGKDGRKQQNVTWSVSSEHAAALTSEGDEATLHATEPYATVTLTAHAGTDSAEAQMLSELTGTAFTADLDQPILSLALALSQQIM